MLSSKLNRAAVDVLHVGVVSVLVAVAVFKVGVRLKLLMTGVVYELSTAFKVVGLWYPLAFLFPIIAIGAALLSAETSRWRRFVVPATYLVSGAILCVVAFALYAPLR